MLGFGDAVGPPADGVTKLPDALCTIFGSAAKFSYWSSSLRSRRCFDRLLMKRNRATTTPTHAMLTTLKVPATAPLLVQNPLVEADKAPLVVDGEVCKALSVEDGAITRVVAGVSTKVVVGIRLEDEGTSERERVGVGVEEERTLVFEDEVEDRDIDVLDDTELPRDCDMDEENADEEELGCELDGGPDDTELEEDNDILILEDGIGLIDGEDIDVSN